ncbi:MarR family transcriptional regulator [Streptomyces sp. ISL-96]|uniref:MarR family winged helix-turn-helix transcriptional regulator n=1 Tax=Streptomyces sp. ISL-96 TaxID=2819191 RepID=UPI001BEA76CC|nr:MarR family transcriptional regulator [Streptomyces sp. ISL-96]MBT2493970.1 MarR family transcriptional regulator [Streptomyces sp. ISL-96]
MDRAGPPDDPLHDFAVQVAEAAEAVVVAWAQASHSASPRLSALQLEALLIARRSPGINLTGLADEVGAAPPAVSRLCDRLEAAGLLRREPAKTSRREIGLVLTLAGNELIDALFARRYALFGDILARMPPAEREHLRAGLLAFSKAARSAGSDQERG